MTKSEEEQRLILLVIEEQHYLFRFKLSQRKELFQHLGRIANDPELNFHWLDAASITKAVRELQHTE